MGESGNGIQNTAPLQKINFVKLVKRPATLFLGARLVKRAGKKNAIRGCWKNVTTFRPEAPILLTATDEAGERNETAAALVCLGPCFGSYSQRRRRANLP